MFETVRRDDDGGRSALGLLLLSGVIATLVTSPLLWLFLRAGQVDPARAASLVFSARTAEILANSVGLMVGVTVLSVAIGVPLAVLTTGTDLPYGRFWTVVAALPLVIPSYIGAFAFVRTFGSGGEVSEAVGLPLPAIDGFPGAVLVITLYTYPYVYLSTRAALLSLDMEIVEAARSLNVPPIEAYRRVVIPQIRPAVAAGALLVALYAVSDFGTPAFMRVSVFTYEIYVEYGAFNVQYAALLSMQLLAVTAVILLIEARIGGDSDSAGGGRTARIRLGRWKWVAMTAIGGIGVITLVLPVAIFGVWALRGPEGSVPSLAFQPGIALNSVYLATMAAAVACLLAIPVAYHSARYDSPLSRLFERATYVGFAVPGVVIGLALVFFGANYAPWIYRTVPLLVFAYVVRFLPQVVGTTRSAVLQVDDRLVEAARTLNAGPVETFRKVTLPLILPGVVAGGVLVFLTTMKELPATLMLQPIGVDTLVTIIWAAHETLYYQYAAVPALILVVISGVSMVVLLRQESGLG
ncbi:iron ABC transporter permease [Halorubrum sp. JWXQ-INN 858]|uniref:ABC transporter permease n=1 Tax=Halorubrum sp. JWXQ-INN 858 TaxID=2690782 RepID=UPI002AA2B234|nr:iron ABC transporter permease [Halorubrum sp. JWXQ-INN 858]